jgi:hypothetical protein
MLFYQAKFVLCRFVRTKLSPFVEYAGKSNAAVTQDDCIFTILLLSPLSKEHSPSFEQI